MLGALTSVNKQTILFLDVTSFKYGKMDPTFQKNMLPPYSGLRKPRGKTHREWKGQVLRQADGSGYKQAAGSSKTSVLF
jgi:hypothetical protein